jgi:hypothetical protein
VHRSKNVVVASGNFGCRYMVAPTAIIYTTVIQNSNANWSHSCNLHCVWLNDQCCIHHHREKEVAWLQAHALRVSLSDVDDNICQFNVHRSYMDDFCRGLLRALFARPMVRPGLRLRAALRPLYQCSAKPAYMNFSISMSPHGNPHSTIRWGFLASSPRCCA